MIQRRQEEGGAGGGGKALILCPRCHGDSLVRDGDAINSPYLVLEAGHNGIDHPTLLSNPSWGQYPRYPVHCRNEDPRPCRWAGSLNPAETEDLVRQIYVRDNWKRE